VKNVTSIIQSGKKLLQIAHEIAVKKLVLQSSPLMVPTAVIDEKMRVSLLNTSAHFSGGVVKINILFSSSHFEHDCLSCLTNSDETTAAAAASVIVQRVFQ
jgi:hypothetical protein